MKNLILIILIFLTLILVLSGSIMALSQEKHLNMLIDISPYISLELGEDIDIDIDKPWQGGEIKESKSGLYLKTNTKVELSWETTVLSNAKTGRVLPLGIPVDFIERLVRGEKVEASEQAFGLNTFLVNKETEANNHNTQRKNSDSSRLDSSVREGNRLQSRQAYQLDPGVHNFDIIVQYYWASEGSWSQIVAGEYTGEIIYTVAAVEKEI
jgi:hypothetical protein